MTNRVGISAGATLIVDLSPQQFATALWLALGFTRLETARLLGVTPGAADQYRQIVMRRTCLRTTAALVRRAIAEGLVPLEPEPGDLEQRARAWLTSDRNLFLPAQEARRLQVRLITAASSAPMTDQCVASGTA